MYVLNTNQTLKDKQNTLYSIYLSASDLLSFIISNTNMNLAVYGNGLAVVMTS